MAEKTVIKALRLTSPGPHHTRLRACCQYISKPKLVASIYSSWVFQSSGDSEIATRLARTLNPERETASRLNPRLAIKLDSRGVKAQGELQNFAAAQEAERRHLRREGEQAQGAEPRNGRKSNSRRQSVVRKATGQTKGGTNVRKARDKALTGKRACHQGRRANTSVAFRRFTNQMPGGRQHEPEPCYKDQCAAEQQHQRAAIDTLAPSGLAHQPGRRPPRSRARPGSHHAGHPQGEVRGPKSQNGCSNRLEQQRNRGCPPARA